jgi:hypothetical protein
MDGVVAVGAVNGGRQLTAEELAEVNRLAARDREVRLHEAQHAAAAGGMASGVQYDYEMGPDGRMYAVGGRVRIFFPPGQTPEEALANARQLRAAAGAPGDPSSQDLAVAARASQMEAEALRRIAQEASAQAEKAADSSQLPPSLRGLNRKA